MTLEEKILDSFTGKVVRKDLAFQVKGGLPVPTFVLEYLLGQNCASDDPEIIAEGLTRVKKIIQENYVHRADANIVKGKIFETGQHRVIDKINVLLNDKANEYQAYFANLGLQRVPIDLEFVKKNQKLLSGNGVWCIVTLGYINDDDIIQHWEIQTLKPIQVSNIDLEEYIEARQKFSTEEWIDMLIHTVGLNPEEFNHREKLITIARLLPHVENNFNFIELGPKGTGKSHVFQELSPYGVLVSGGDVTSARLFVKMSGNNELLGLVGYWDIVAWDEFEQQPGRSVDATLIDTMQNYLANKSFNRGKGTHEASCSMVFVGNTKHTVPFMLRNSNLFESIPNSFIKGAFLDRMHLYNPGWEVKMLKKASFSKGYGLITDYIAAILHELRNRDLTALLANYADFDTSLSERDHLAIRKTFSGLVKLIYPDGKMTDEEAFELINFATEGRKRVKDQLYSIDETFKAEPAKFVYKKKNGEEVTVETLEQIEFKFEESMRQAELDSLRAAEQNNANDEPAVYSQNAAHNNTAPNDTQEETFDQHYNRSSITYRFNNSLGLQRKRIAAPTLVSKTITIQENQSGISYKKLFGDYLRDAKKITLVDPYIRSNHQVDNFVDFVQMVQEVSSVIENGIEIHLSTQNDDDEKVSEMIDTFTDLTEEFLSFGIDFTYDFDADHDRYIKTDTGWLITMGRGLDIFERFNRYSLCRGNQENRRCKPFSVAYNKTEETSEKPINPTNPTDNSSNS